MRIKKFSVSLILLFLTTLGLSNFVAAQTKPRKYFHPAPTRLVLPGDENEDAEFDKGVLLREHFYPIGWSKDGKFAYLVEPADEACGCYFADLIVQDMRTDKILWTNKYEGQETGEENTESHWRKNQKLFSRKLAEYKIVAGKNFKLLTSPLAVGDDSIKIDLFSNVELADDLYSSKGSVVLKLIAGQKKAKIVYQKSYPGKNYDGVMSVETGGVLLSPFEARAAIILIETKRGWEGPPHITKLRIIGANLTGGYR